MPARQRDEGPCLNVARHSEAVENSLECPPRRVFRGTLKRELQQRHSVSCFDDSESRTTLETTD